VSRVSSIRWFVIAGLLLGVALVVLVSPFANPDPDGLNRVALDEGFAASETDHELEESPLADYAVRGVDNERISKGLSGVIGLLATFALGLGLFTLMRKRKTPDTREGTQD
jgi:PDGLE domain